MKPTLVISCPVDTYSGYGGRSRDFIKALIKLDKFDIQILPQKWGNTRWGYLKDHNETELESLFIKTVPQNPDIWIQCTIPNEFQPVGKFNIGLTAAMETDLCDGSWIQGANRMDLLIVSSEHSKFSLENSKYEVEDKRTGQRVPLALETPVEVLFEGIDLDFNVDQKMLETLRSIPEQNRFFATGHWMQGILGEDRKNIGLTIKSFLTTFKNAKVKPALILKTSTGGAGVMDREKILHQIEKIRSKIKGKLPNIYLIHGDVSDDAMHTIYSKGNLTGYISLTKGEGFGRTMLEASLHGIPIMVSGWSGHLDFLDKEKCLLVGGQLKNVHPSAAVKNMILPQAKWFSPDEIDVNRKMKALVEDKKNLKISAKKLAYKNKQDFSTEAMKDKLEKILNEHAPELGKPLELPKLELPTIQKFN